MEPLAEARESFLMGPALPPLPDIPAVLAAAKRRRQRRWLMVLLVLAAAGLVARPVYRWGKQWRSRDLAIEAERLLAAGQTSQAVAKVQAAHRLDPLDPITLRAAAHVASRVGATAAFDYWKALAALPEATITDRREAVQYALKAAQFDFAEEQLQGLLQREPEALENLQLAVQYTIEKGDRSAALECLRILLFHFPGNREALLAQARLLIVSPEPTQVEEGHRSLRKLGKDETPLGLEALELLAREERLTSLETAGIAGALEAHPLARAEDHLLAASLRLRLHPEQRAAEVELAFRRFADGPAEEKVALGRWALGLGESARVVEFIPTETALTKQELFLVRADALAALGRWKEIETMIGNESAPLPTLFREAFLARAAKELHDRGAEAHWDLAILAAARNPQLTLYLSQYAEKAGEAEVAIKVWQQLASDPRWTLRAEVALVPMLERKGDTRALREVVRKIAQLAPKDTAPRNDAAYLDLLLEENVAAANKVAEALVAENPQSVIYRTTLALAHLRSGDPRAAADTLQPVTAALAQALPRCQVIRAAVLAANGAPAEAKEAASAAATKRLLPEEAALLPKG